MEVDQICSKKRTKNKVYLLAWRQFLETIFFFSYGNQSVQERQYLAMGFWGLGGEKHLVWCKGRKHTDHNEINKHFLLARDDCRVWRVNYFHQRVVPYKFRRMDHQLIWKIILFLIATVSQLVLSLKTIPARHP